VPQNLAVLDRARLQEAEMAGAGALTGMAKPLRREDLDKAIQSLTLGFHEKPGGV